MKIRGIAIGSTCPILGSRFRIDLLCGKKDGQTVATVIRLLEDAPRGVRYKVADFLMRADLPQLRGGLSALEADSKPGDGDTITAVRCGVALTHSPATSAGRLAGLGTTPSPRDISICPPRFELDTAHPGVTGGPDRSGGRPGKDDDTCQ